MVINNLCFRVHCQNRTNFFPTANGCHCKVSSPAKWGDDTRTALCPSPPSCGGIPSEACPRCDSASPWTSPRTWSYWYRDGRPWIPHQRHQWSPRAGGRWRRNEERRSECWKRLVEIKWEALALCHFMQPSIVSAAELQTLWNNMACSGSQCRNVPSYFCGYTRNLLGFTSNICTVHQLTAHHGTTCSKTLMLSLPRLSPICSKDELIEQAGYAVVSFCDISSVMDNTCFRWDDRKLLSPVHSSHGSDWGWLG